MMLDISPSVLDLKLQNKNKAFVTLQKETLHLEFTSLPSKSFSAVVTVSLSFHSLRVPQGPEQESWHY